MALRSSGQPEAACSAAGALQLALQRLGLVGNGGNANAVSNSCSARHTVHSSISYLVYVSVRDCSGKCPMALRVLGLLFRVPIGCPLQLSRG